MGHYIFEYCYSAYGQGLHLDVVAQMWESFHEVQMSLFANASKHIAECTIVNYITLDYKRLHLYCRCCLQNSSIRSQCPAHGPEITNQTVPLLFLCQNTFMASFQSKAPIGNVHRNCISSARLPEPVGLAPHNESLA